MTTQEIYGRYVGTGINAMPAPYQDRLKKDCVAAIEVSADAERGKCADEVASCYEDSMHPAAVAALRAAVNKLRGY